MDVLLYVALLLWLLLIPILLLMMNSDRKAAGRTWGCHLHVCFVVLRDAVKAERELWLYVLAVFVAWTEVFHFWPLPDLFDAWQATGTEIAKLFLGWGLFFVWFGGMFYAGIRTSIRLAEPTRSGRR